MIDFTLRNTKKVAMVAIFFTAIALLFSSLFDYLSTMASSIDSPNLQYAPLLIPDNLNVILTLAISVRVTILTALQAQYVWNKNIDIMS